jgi:transcriptional regulator with XRE-family HTH domain
MEALNRTSKSLGSQITKYRTAKDLTQEELANLISKTRSTVNLYEKGKINIPFKVVHDIGEALGVDLPELFAGSFENEVFSLTKDEAVYGYKEISAALKELKESQDKIQKQNTVIIKLIKRLGDQEIDEILNS